MLVYSIEVILVRLKDLFEISYYFYKEYFEKF